MRVAAPTAAWASTALLARQLAPYAQLAPTAPTLQCSCRHLLDSSLAPAPPPLLPASLALLSRHSLRLVQLAPRPTAASAVTASLARTATKAGTARRAPRTSGALLVFPISARSSLTRQPTLRCRTSASATPATSATALWPRPRRARTAGPPSIAPVATRISLTRVPPIRRHLLARRASPSVCASLASLVITGRIVRCVLLDPSARAATCLHAQPIAYPRQALPTQASACAMLGFMEQLEALVFNVQSTHTALAVPASATVQPTPGQPARRPSARGCARAARATWAKTTQRALSVQAGPGAGRASRTCARLTPTLHPVRRIKATAPAMSAMLALAVGPPARRASLATTLSRRAHLHARSVQLAPTALAPLVDPPPARLANTVQRTQLRA